MNEYINVRQIPGDPERRWFYSDDFDLIVWFSDDRGIAGFELCYDKNCNMRSIEWSKTKGFRHMAVDDGEQRPGRHKASPILVPDGPFDAMRVYTAFLEASKLLPKEIANYVLQALEQHPQISSAHA